MNENRIQRVLWIVLDGVGAGEAPDAKQYGDPGSNTLGNLSRVFKKQEKRALKLPNLAAMGISKITPMEGVEAGPLNFKGGVAFGRAQELSEGKDTTSGHWEMAGLVVDKAFATFPNGFPKSAVDEWVQANSLPGVLGNKAASGTEIIEELGAQHLKTGKPILYTSADSVWQVAAHENVFGLDRLYKICESARTLCDRLQISRVIARPFVGNPAEGKPFQRTYNRKDYAQTPFRPTVLDLLTQDKCATLGVGKISSIYAGHGIQKNIDTHGNAEGIQTLIQQLDRSPSTHPELIFANLIDFDMLYGHRRDVQGFGKSLEELDTAIPELLKRLRPNDLLILTADHGNDPTYRGTDHTREFIPVLVASPSIPNHAQIDLGIRGSFGDIGATVLDALHSSFKLQSPDNLEANLKAVSLEGHSFLNKLNLNR